MRTTVINIKTKSQMRAKAKKSALELGFSLSSLINGYLNQLIRTKTIHFSTVEENPSEYMIEALREAEDNRKKGRYKSFESKASALSFVDKIINEDKKN